MTIIDKAKGIIEKAKEKTKGIEVPDIQIPTDIDVTKYLKDTTNVITTNIDTAIDRTKESVSNIAQRIEIPSLPTERLTKYNVFTRISEIETTLKDLKQWRVYEADPNFLNIFNEIKSVILPQLNNVANRIQESANKAEAALIDAEKAANIAKNAENFSKSFIIKLVLAGDMINYGTKDMTYAAQGIHNALTNEVINISNSFSKFGRTILDKAVVMGNEAQDLGREMIDSGREILIPLGYCVDEAVDASNELSDAKDALGDLDIEKVVNYAIKGARSLKNSLETLVYKGYGGQQSVLLEIHEAINAIGKEGNDLGQAILDFGQQTFNGTRLLGVEFRNSVNNIKREISFFTDTYKRIFGDLYLIFTKEYTDEEIVIEIEKRRKDREKYFAVMDDLNTYETNEALCNDANYNIPIKESEIQLLNQKYDFIVAKYIPEINNIVKRFNNEVNRLENFGIYIKDKTLIDPDDPRWSDGRCDVVTIGKPKPPSPPFVIQECHEEPRPYDVLEGGLLGAGLGETKKLYIWYDDNGVQQMTETRPPPMTVCTETIVDITVLDSIRSDYFAICCKRMKELRPIKNEILKKENELQALKEEATNICNKIKELSAKFTTRWGLTPEQADLLTYEEIVNLNV